MVKTKYRKGKMLSLFFIILIPILLITTVFSSTILSYDIFYENSDKLLEDITTVSILPSPLTVAPGEDFVISIFCNPTEPVEGYEFDLDFNASLIQANLVTQGNFFGDFSTFFNDGTIDNINGYIDNIYELILEEANVSEPGYFANITFTAGLNPGVCYLNFEDAGVSNETSYISISIENGSVIIGDNPPTASFVWTDADGSGYGTIIDFDASGSSDDFGIISYDWDFDNDGFYDDATGMFISYDLEDTDLYTIHLKVTDTINQTDTFSDDVQAKYKSIKNLVNIGKIKWIFLTLGFNIENDIIF